MGIDGLLIFILVLAGFWRYRVERQKEIDTEIFERTRAMYGNLDVGKS